MDRACSCWQRTCLFEMCQVTQLDERKTSVLTQSLHPAQVCLRKGVAIMKSVHSKSSGKLQTATDVDKNINVKCVFTAVTHRGNSLKSDCKSRHLLNNILKQLQH